MQMLSIFCFEFSWSRIRPMLLRFCFINFNVYGSNILVVWSLFYFESRKNLLLHHLALGDSQPSIYCHLPGENAVMPFMHATEYMHLTLACSSQVPITAGWTEAHGDLIQSLPKAFTHDQSRESNPRPCYQSPTRFTTWPHAPHVHLLFVQNVSTGITSLIVFPGWDTHFVKVNRQPKSYFGSG